MKYLSVCSGIEAATVAWHPLGWEPQAFSEIEKFPSAVLNYRYPSIPNLKNMANYKEWDIGKIDMLVGGTPCQSFSVAGLRKGLDDPRGNLSLVYLGIAERFRPCWILWENVPGVLSSYTGPQPPSNLEEEQEWKTEETSDFECFTTALAQLGYGFAFRVLDAQYFGVPQRRRRVFVVGYLGDWRRAAAVLFEHHCLQGHTPPSREKREGTPKTIGGSTVQYNSTAPTLDASHDRKWGSNQWVDNGFGILASMHTTGAGFWQEGVGTLRAREQDSHENLICTVHGTQDPITSNNAFPVGRNNGGENVIAFTQNDGGRDASMEVSPTLRSGGDGGLPVSAVAYSMITANTNANGIEISRKIAPTIDQAQPAAVAIGMGGGQTGYALRANPSSSGDKGEGGMNTTTVISKIQQVRRLTPIECERLQGFLDNYTQIPWRGKPKEQCPLGHRYKALGNSMAVPVMRWLGERIAMVDKI